MLCTLSTVGRGCDVRELLRGWSQGHGAGKDQRQDSNPVLAFCVLAHILGEWYLCFINHVLRKPKLY